MTCLIRTKSVVIISGCGLVQSLTSTKTRQPKGKNYGSHQWLRKRGKRWMDELQQGLFVYSTTTLTTSEAALWWAMKRSVLQTTFLFSDSSSCKQAERRRAHWHLKQRLTEETALTWMNLTESWQIYLVDVILAANDEQRQRKGADHLSVLVGQQQSTTSPALTAKHCHLIAAATCCFRLCGIKTSVKSKTK